MILDLRARSPRLLLVIALLVTACSPSSSTPSGGAGGGNGAGGTGAGGGTGTNPGSCAAGKNSCSPGTDFCCADYAGLFTAASVQQGCSAAMGTYSPDPCTIQDREGSCTLYPGTAAEKTIRYYPGYDAESMSDPATNCSALHGMFVPN